MVHIHLPRSMGHSNIQRNEWNKSPKFYASKHEQGFAGDSVVNKSPANAGRVFHP